MLSVVVSGCPEGPPDGGDGGEYDDGGTAPPCEPHIVGDDTLDMIIEPVLRTATGSQVDLHAFDDVELFRPPQGGKVFLVGARVKNVDTCGLRITGTLRDPCSERILGLEGRPFRTVVTDAGWAEPLNPRSLSNYANVPACPRAAADRNMDDEVYELTIVVEDRNERESTVTIPVVPRCVQPGALGDQCRCECLSGYVLGGECPDDAGVSFNSPPTDDAGVAQLFCEDE